MAKNPRDSRKLTVRYESFHRYWTGLSVSSLVLTILASAIAGARTITITYRCVVVIVILSLLGRIIIRSWASLEEMKRGENQTSRK